MRTEERLSLQDAAEALGVSEQTARRWVKTGKLKAYKPGLRYLIPASAISELLERSSDPKAVPPPESVHSERHDLPSLEDIAEEAGHPLGWIVASEEAFRDAFKGRSWGEVLEKAERVVEEIQAEHRDFRALVDPIALSTPYSSERERHFKRLYNHINWRPMRARFNAKEAADRAEAEGAPSDVVEGLKNVALSR